MKKPKVIIFNDYFYPAFKAGGPIQSLSNLVIAFEHEFEMYIVCGSHDLHEKEALLGIKTDSWNDVIVPGSQKTVKVWYASKLALGRIQQILNEISPSSIYLNGIFSVRYFMLPLMASRNFKVIVCPRGMLQKGALAGKALKKKMYLYMLKNFAAIGSVTWHATNEAEQRDICRVFGQHTKCIVAHNIPRSPVATPKQLKKQPGELRLIYLSLISEKKNLLQLINLISKMKWNISLDIYGPVKDKSYWEKCKAAIRDAQSRIAYHGEVLPDKVQEVISKYHVFTLLTKGENFGHALYESLGTGRPILTSHFTPWNKLENKSAGWNTDITDLMGMEKLLAKLFDFSQPEFDRYCEGALRLAKEYYSKGFDKEAYTNLFTNQMN